MPLAYGLRYLFTELRLKVQFVQRLDGALRPTELFPAQRNTRQKVLLGKALEYDQGGKHVLVEISFGYKRDLRRVTIS